ncbi:MAG: hypothetical protein P6H82_00325 [Candidatus Arsenophonus melophagi]|nr:hypothetical protein [Candidatus Arsenophonus melophagi]
MIKILSYFSEFANHANIKFAWLANSDLQPIDGKNNSLPLW